MSSPPAPSGGDGRLPPLPLTAVVEATNTGFPNPNCRDCAWDPQGAHHYHCVQCGRGPTSMLGHYRGGEFVDGAFVKWDDYRFVCPDPEGPA